jgi:hypothetical protein
LGARPRRSDRSDRSRPRAFNKHPHHHTETKPLETAAGALASGRDYRITAATTAGGRGSCLFNITQTIERTASAPSWYRRNQQHDEIVEANRQALQIHPVAIQIKSY